MAVFGQFEAVIVGTRLCIPAEIRRLIASQGKGRLFAKLGDNGVIWLYPEERFVSLTSVRDLSITSEALERSRFHFAVSFMLEWDRRGRIVLPERLRRQALHGRKVVIVGARDHLEIWDRDAWQRRMDELLDAVAIDGR